MRDTKNSDCISEVDFMFRSISYEDSLDNEYKKQFGIYYTDANLAKMLLSLLSIPEKSTIIDPNCGMGSFLYAAQQLGYSELYGADIDRGVIKKCRENIIARDIVLLDTIAANSQEVLKSFGRSEKFDYVVGNPPYVPIDRRISIDTPDYLFLRSVKDSGSNLFVGAIYRSLELLTDNGTLMFIIPKNFLHIEAYSPLRRFLLKEKMIISVVDLGKYFKNVRGEQVVLTVKNCKPKQDNRIKLMALKNGNVIDNYEIYQTEFKDEIILFDNETEKKLYDKLESSYEKFHDICTGYVGRGKSKSQHAVTGKDIRKFGLKNLDLPRNGNKIFIQNIYSAESGIIASYGGNLDASETVTIFTDGDEKMCRYILGVLHSRLCNFYLMKYCYNNSSLTMHTDAKYLKRLPLVKNDSTFNQVLNLVSALETIEYMSENWFEFLEALNKVIYQTYSISNGEANYIDEAVKKFQSKRWNNDKK